MEIHRLIPMKEGYDESLFNRLYHETKHLRDSLAFQIDSRRYGVTPDIIRSWFDDKFIFVFNKYYGTITDDQLKGRIINSLKVFKFRILRKAYSKYNLYNNQVRLEGENNLINIIPNSSEISNHDLFLELALKYLRKNLCDDAFLVLEIELNPPPFILSQINPNTKIPAKLIAEYLELPPDKDSISYIKDLNSEINYWICEAKDHFKEYKFANQLQ